MITDNALRQLTSLKELQYLNLAGTSVTAEGLMQLKPLAKLKNLYLYRTQIKSTDYSILKNNFPSVSIDTGGYRVPVLVSDTTQVKAGKK